MRVTIFHDQHYDFEPLPADIVPTEADKVSGRVIPSANNDGWRVRVTRKLEGNHTSVAVSEGTIIARLIHDAMPNQGRQTLTRKQALGQLLAINVMPKHAHSKGFTRIHVECDDGPDEKLFRELVTPYTLALDVHGEPLIDPIEFDARLAAYMTPDKADDHAAHLHEKFKVKAVAQ